MFDPEDARRLPRQRRRWIENISISLAKVCRHETVNDAKHERLNTREARHSAAEPKFAYQHEVE